LRALGIAAGDEVIIPDFTYPATADVIEIVGAKIVIVDVVRETMPIDFDALEQAISFPRTTVKGIHLLKVMDDCQ
jgi:dTDP-4-amino-4,6-dideoxygalactose transaminase